MVNNNYLPDYNTGAQLANLHLIIGQIAIKISIMELLWIKVINVK